jgi:hypothetical protein
LVILLVRLTTQLRDIDPRLLPCLFIGDSGRPVIILEQKAGHLKVYANGHVRKISKGDMAVETGEAWIFERYDENRAVTSKFMRAGSAKAGFQLCLGDSAAHSAKFFWPASC